MEQMNVPDEMKVKIDFNDDTLPHAFRTLQPLLYVNGDSFCCVLGPDPQQGVFGCGTTREAALTNWEANMRERIIYHNAGDELAQFIEDKLNASMNNVG